jgi:hypothetical protein
VPSAPFSDKSIASNVSNSPSNSAIAVACAVSRPVFLRMIVLTMLATPGGQ